MKIKTYTAINPHGREVRVNVADKNELQNLKDKGFVFGAKKKAKKPEDNQ